MGYLGSLCGLDPSESGPHGPWLLEIAGDQLGMRQVALAPLRWEEVEVDVSGIAFAEDVHRAVIAAIDAAHDRLAGADHGPKAVGCRLRFTGRSGLRGAIERRLAADDPRRLHHVRDGVSYFIHEWGMAAHPALDLHEMAQGHDPAALLARKLLLLRQGDCAERRQLLADARTRLDRTAARPVFSGVSVDPLAEPDLVDILERAGLRALDALLAQQATQS